MASGLLIAASLNGEFFGTYRSNTTPVPIPIPVGAVVSERLVTIPTLVITPKSPSYKSILFSSLPMWSLAILGSFGGYDTDDLALFSTVSNRLKGLLIGISMISVSYVLYTFSCFSITF